MSKPESNSRVVEMVQSWTSEEHLLANAERYKDGHPFSKLAVSGLEQAVNARQLGSLKARVDGGKPAYDRHLSDYPPVDMAEAA